METSICRKLAYFVSIVQFCDPLGQQRGSPGRGMVVVSVMRPGAKATSRGLLPKTSAALRK